MNTGGGLPAGRTSWQRQIRDPQVRVALVAAACLLVAAVVAKNVLEVEMDFASQFAALWIFLAYQLSGRRDRASELAFVAAIVLVTVAVLVLYAV